jgi:hypothetical protein
MTTIYKHRINAGRLSALKPETQATKTAEIKHIFNITSSVLQYRIENTTDNETHCNIKINLSDIKNHRRFCSQSIFSLTDLAALGAQSTQYTVTPFDLDNTLDNTWNTKRNSLFLIGDDISSVFPMKIFVNSEDADFTTFSYIVLCPDMTYSNTEGWEQTFLVETNVGTIEPDYVQWKTLFEQITATSQNTNAVAGDTILVNVSVEDTTIPKVYAETISGVVDKTEIQLTNGQGSFSILTNTLSTGESVKVKLGHKLFSNITTFEQVLK